MTKRYAVPAFSFVTFLPWMVSPIVKPGPTVPLTVLAEAAEPPPVAASATAATAPSSQERVRILLMSFGLLRVRALDRAHDRTSRSSKARTVIRTVETPRTFLDGPRMPALRGAGSVDVEH